LPIFRVKSVKIYTGQKNLHKYIRGVRDKYEVWTQRTRGLSFFCLCELLHTDQRWRPIPKPKKESCHMVVVQLFPN